MPAARRVLRLCEIQLFDDMKRISPFLFPLISFGVVILLWHVVVKAGLLQELVMPSPWTVAKAFYKFFKEGEFFIHLWASFIRIITGFSIGAFFGVIFGILVGHFRLFERFFDPLIQALRPIPIAAWLPLAIVWFGIGDKPGIFLIVIGVFFPVFINTVHGVKFTQPILIRAAHMLGATPGRLLVYVVLPAALPNILTGIRIGLGLAWVCVVISELLGVTAGLGFVIWDAQVYLHTEKVIVGMIVIGIMGMLTDRIVLYVSSKLLKG
jgi:ABC-type nitrate/sulfonate/bicarbonate transport system permease component